MDDESHLTETEIESLNASDLSKQTPFVIRGVSLGYFSVARHYGGATFNGSHYTYISGTDELVRDDVLKFLAERGGSVRYSQQPRGHNSDGE